MIDDDDEIAISRTSTKPLELQRGDRVALERRIDQLYFRIQLQLAILAAALTALAWRML